MTLGRPGTLHRLGDLLGQALAEQEAPALHCRPPGMHLSTVSETNPLGAMGRGYMHHTFAPEEGDEEFYCTGRAEPVLNPDVRAGVVAAYHRRPRETELLFELKIEQVLHTFWENWPKPGMRPIRAKWHATTPAQRIR